ncbi:hypothetical protein EO93_10480 [Methanosarcina sp. 1.H.A.2.2]|nr:hypothetical protein EO93_10480 [Methanosarcina sp. 1.H.A.2.2]
MTVGHLIKIILFLRTFAESRLKQYALFIIFAVLSIVLVGIPAMFFTNSIFVANLYGRLVERKAGYGL